MENFQLNWADCTYIVHFHEIFGTNLFSDLEENILKYERIKLYL